MRVSVNSGFYSARPDNKTRYSMLEAVDFFYEVGFDAVDINLCATIYGDPRTSGKLKNKVREPILDGDWQANITEVKKRAEQYGLPTELSHLPFFKYDGKNTVDLDYNMEMSYRCLDANVILGTKWTVAHFMADMDAALEYLRPICKYATERNIGIAVENTPRATIEALCEAVDVLSSEGYKVGICLDVGHANYAGCVPADAVRMMEKRIKMLHIHDNYGDRDAHQPPFSGNINWKELMTSLADVGYCGDLNFEINTANVPEACRKEHARYVLSIGRYLVSIYDARKAELLCENKQ